MNKWLAASWLAILIPFGIAAVSGGPEAPWGHAVFHLGYIAFAVLAIFMLLAVRRSAQARSVRGIALGVAAAQLLFITGQIGELLVVASHPGPHAGEDALADPTHDIPSLALTAPGLLLSFVGIIALTVVVIRAQRRRALATLGASA